MIVQYLTPHLLSIAGGLCILFFLSKMLRERRQPGSTLAWFLSIIVVPYIGIPLYLLLGSRKRQRAKGTVRSEYDLDTFPSRFHNSVRILADGAEAFEVITDVLSQAKHSISVSTFILEQDRCGQEIVRILAERARSGVNVRLVTDGIGSYWLDKNFLQDLKRAGGHTAIFLPPFQIAYSRRANLRNHRKIILIDDAKAIVGGMNLAENCLSTTSKSWKDLSFLIEGEAVSDLSKVFQSDWDFVTGRESKGIEHYSEKNEGNDGFSLQVIPSGPDVEGDSLYDEIVDSIFQSTENITVVTPYFIPDETLLRALCIAAKKGVQVVIIIPKRSNHPLVDFVRESYLAELAEQGVSIKLFTPGMLHAKVIVFDAKKAIIGSANMDIRSMMLNYEVGLKCHNPSLIEALETWKAEITACCEEYRKRNGALRETLQGMARVLAPLL